MHNVPSGNTGGRFTLAALCAFALAGFTGCASVPSPPPAAADVSCTAWFAALDAAVERAGVRDAEADRIDGFAALRVNRLAAALAPQAARSEAAFAAWLDALRTLDLAARRIELANLPASTRPPTDRLDACSAQLAGAVAGDAAARAALLRSARVPERYSRVSRTVGLYALTRVPFFAGVQRWQREHEAAMRAAAHDPQPARRFVPDAAPQQRPAAHLERDALGLPIIDEATAERLLRAHAPVFDIEQRGAFDGFGTPTWASDGRIDIDRSRPTVYQRIAFTLVRGQALFQLVYTLWFPERPRTGAFDLLGGALDGVIVRLTLAPDGTPMLLDTIHACGCWHLFFPGPGVAARPGAPALEEWAFAPARLPALAHGERVVVRIGSATHDVLGVTTTADANTPAVTAYAHASESALRTLPRADAGTRSLYGPDGLVAGTERAERFFFWPMGIANAGATRQWGHHATAFVGQRHFDDADLIDRRFAFPLPP